MAEPLVLRPMQYTAAGARADPLSAGELSCLAEVRDVLRSRGLLHRFGICRAFDHVFLRSYEVMYEIADVASRVLTAAPECDPYTKPAIQTQWVFTEKKTGLRCHMVCQIDSRGHYSEHLERLAGDNPVNPTHISKNRSQRRSEP